MKKPRPRRPVTTPDTRKPRIDVRGRVEAEIGLAGCMPEVIGEVRNLNYLGMYMWADQMLPVNAEVEFRLKIPEEGAAVDGRGWVVFANERSIAVQFDNLTPENEATLKGFLDRCRSAA